jgi:CHAT domain-containing protein
VLAACQTAYDSDERGNGTTTIAAAFLRAGAASVIGTIWNVDDVASKDFFLSVHRRLLSGQSPSQAVASAQRACYASAECRRAAATTWIGTAAYGSE